MADKSHIEWTDATWNPVTGCTKKSAGCKNCYALREWPRLSAPRPVPNIYTGRAFTDVQFHPERLGEPSSWRKPRMIFVNSMSDLFHEAVTDQQLEAVFAEMLATGRHTYQVLTKRVDRARDWLRRIKPSPTPGMLSLDGAALAHEGGTAKAFPAELWPLPNVWLLASVEDQPTADERVPQLLECRAAVRGLSIEPLIGPVRIPVWRIDVPGTPCDIGGVGLHWVIVGGESGPKARPMHPDWARSLRDQCAAVGVPFFFKQWGEWAPPTTFVPCTNLCSGGIDGEPDGFGGAIGGTCRHCGGSGCEPTVRVGKKAAGRQLDGRSHDGFPETRAA